MSEPIIRDLQESDLINGFLDTLKFLTHVGDIDINAAKQRFSEIKSNPDYVIKVAEVDGKIVATTTLFIESKFIHNLGHVGHIEDVVTDKQFQGKGLSKKIIFSLLQEAKKRGCYKTILDCDDDLVPFYEKITIDDNSFHKHGNCMRFDHV
jgi:glucosamine-phosphate N-acetyltransferase